MVVETMHVRRAIIEGISRVGSGAESVNLPLLPRGRIMARRLAGVCLGLMIPSQCDREPAPTGETIAQELRSARTPSPPSPQQPVSAGTANGHSACSVFDACCAAIEAWNANRTPTEIDGRLVVRLECCQGHSQSRRFDACLAVLTSRTMRGVATETECTAAVDALQLSLPVESAPAVCGDVRGRQQAAREREQSAAEARRAANATRVLIDAKYGGYWYSAHAASRGSDGSTHVVFDDGIEADLGAEDVRCPRTPGEPIEVNRGESWHPHWVSSRVVERETDGSVISYRIEMHPNTRGDHARVDELRSPGRARGGLACLDSGDAGVSASADRTQDRPHRRRR